MVFSEKCQMQLSSVSSVIKWCNQSLVCYFQTQYKLMNALNRNMISLPKFHSFIVWFKDICLNLMFALILPGSSSEITCRLGRYRGRSDQHVALQIEQLWNLSGWRMLCVASNLQDIRQILLEQWDTIPHIRIIRLIRSTRRMGAFGGIDKHVSHRPNVALRVLALFTIDTHPVLRLIAGATIIRKLHLLSQSKVE